MSKLWTIIVIAAVGVLLTLAPVDSALAVNCSDAPYNGVIDGNFVSAPDQIQIDTNCTIRNFPFPNVLGTNFSFYTQPGGNTERWLVVFDNVAHTGNMSCNSTHEHRIWFTNGSSTKIQEGCQNLLIPVEKIDKRNPAGQATAAVGVPFTYSLTIPVLYDPARGVVIDGSGSLNTLHGITVWDDLNATGVDLTYVNHAAYWQGNGTAVPHTFTNAGGQLTFDFPSGLIIPANDQIVIEITVVLEDTPNNVAGRQFTNTAKWQFGRLIDGVFYEPLPGEWGISSPMTIAEPNLVVTKTSVETALNLGVLAGFTIDVQNVGGSDAWDVSILDQLPDGADAGMCDYDPRTVNLPAEPGVSASIVAADGSLVRNLTQGTDYSLTYTGPGACQLGLTLTTAAGPIAPEQRLLITYTSQLDGDTTADGRALTNVAGATGWFAADSSQAGRRAYSRTLSDGTPSVLDHQDSATVTTALSGYYFQKTVENLTSHVNPATAATPGDQLRYRLRLFNVDQTIDDITISDPLDPDSFEFATFAMASLPAGAAYNFNPVTGLLTINGDPLPLGVAVGDELVIEFDITLKPTLANGAVVLNQASFSAAALGALSDDPYVNGIAPPGQPADPTRIVIQTPGPLAKAATRPSATIGEQFSYRISVPASPISSPLYDVRILDDLGGSAADLRFVSASVVSGGAWALTNTGVNNTQLVIEDTITGIDIPANGQAVVEITVELLNSVTNSSGLAFGNTASYTYNRTNGDDGTQISGGAGIAADMTIVEPAVTAAAKTVRFVSPAVKAVTDPVAVGDVLEYALTIPNSGSAIAYDTSVVDTLPATLSLVADTATARLNGVDVSGFVANPTTLADGALAWGRENGDATLDIPVGQVLELTYQVTVVAVDSDVITNSVFIDWTSLAGALAAERTGAGCPAVAVPNDYCYGPVTASVSALDRTAILKAVVEDSYAETPASTSDPVVRVGDTVTYELTLQLQEFTTRSVVVEDALPAGMVLESFTIDAGPGFSYTLSAQPTAGASGALRWEFGDIVNPPSGDGSPTDALIIRYVARVAVDAPPAGVGLETSILRDNQAMLSYAGGDPAVSPERLSDTARIEVRQPQMRTISKVDLGSGRSGSGSAADPFLVNLASDVMDFRLASCNDGLAPAYGLVITDHLAAQLDEGDLASQPPVVRLGATVLVAGTDYTYIAPGRGGDLQVALLDTAPVQPGECVSVDYRIGFHTDLTASQIWSNQARIQEYRSLPVDGRRYAPTETAQVWMTNLVSDEQLLKTLVSPVSGEATIGEEVVYQIAVPAVPINVALVDVVVIDTLPAALEYVDATATLNGAPLALAAAVAGQTLTWPLGGIPAGQQAIITLQTRVANNDQANAGTSIVNSASYTYAGMPAGTVTGSTSAPLNIIEPLITVNKTATATAPRAGDVLTWSLNFSAAGAAAGDNFANAYDLTVEDSLSPGLLYEPGSATLNGAALADPATNGADGVGSGQTLVWSPADGIDIDIPEGATVTIAYRTRVLDSVEPGQTLSNRVIGRWTGLNNDLGAIERTGSGTPEFNDYVTDPATLSLTTPLEVAFVKSVVNVTTGEDPGANASPGDSLRYTLVLRNESVVPVNGATVVDDLVSQFVPGSLQVLAVSDPNADLSHVLGTGGAHGTGRVDIRNLTLAAAGEAGDTLTIEFAATLAAVLPSGTLVLNQALLTQDNLPLATSNETSTLIRSAPLLQVWKTSQDLSDDPNVLMAGETLRYSITVKNVGNENATGVTLRDQVPANTTYVAGSTTLNGTPVADTAPGVSPLQYGLPTHAPEDPTAGAMRADAGETSANVATITFDVVVSPFVADGAIISNQGFVAGSGQGSGAFPEKPSDDPDTQAVDDPTRDIVGNLPLVYATKTVQIVGEIAGGTTGIVDPGDILRYTITITNSSATPATRVTLTDAVPQHTTYVSDSLRLNGLQGQPDNGISPLIAGIAVSSSDRTPPLPAAGAGSLSPDGGTAVVTFDVQVDAGTASGTLISNQAQVGSSQLPPLPTDADGVPGNGAQPTQVVVGDAQMLAITKEVTAVGGLAEAGGQLEYVLRVTNISTVPATNVVITDDLSPFGTNPYVAGSATVNGLPGGVSYAAPVLAVAYGELAPGAVVVLRFRVQVDATLPIGTTLTNTGVVTWSDPARSAAASVSIDLGGAPGSGALNGSIWHDANLDKLRAGSEQSLEGWSVELYRSTQLLAAVRTDAGGAWRLTGLPPNDNSGEPYELRFRAAGAGPDTAHLGFADSPPAYGFSNGSQRIGGITVAPGSNLQNLNMPVSPNGVVYNSILRNAVAGARLALLAAATRTALPGQCFDDPAQQNQVTARDGFYKFDLNFSEPSCRPGEAYVIEVTPPAGYTGPSVIIPPNGEESIPFSVPACPGNADNGDALPATVEYCEATTLATAPGGAVRPRSDGTTYHLYLTLSNGLVPGQSQIFNNHIPLDPGLLEGVFISKTSSLINVTKGQLVPYTITVNNDQFGVPLYDIAVVDQFPAGFKYVEGSARLNRTPREPLINGRQMLWDNLELLPNEKIELQLLLVVGAGVSEGEYVNRAHVINTVTSAMVSGVASATVRVIPDPTFDCTDIIGKVFDDRNLNGRQDAGEEGLAGVRVVTARGLIASTDEHGRFHITCAVVPDEDRGSNFILKLDDRSLPTGYRVTTENPRVQRATRGKMLRFNFGATIHRVVAIDIADGVFEPETTELRPQWQPKIGQLLAELKKSPSVLRLSYLADVERDGLVRDRLQALKKVIAGEWNAEDGGYRLDIETEVFWRRGGPPER